MAHLRDFQSVMQNAGFDAWAEPNVYNVLMNLATGGGKTVLFCDTVVRFNYPAAIIAHRQELVSQSSLSLNRERVPHDIIAPKKVLQQIIKLHYDTHGYSVHAYRSPIRVVGVDTLPNQDHKDRWFSDVGLVVHDEAHHVLRTNKWGKAHALFPNAYGLGVTAHAVRADGHGLGRAGSGIFDRLVVGPSFRDLINRGYLCDYRLYCPESDIDFSDVPIGATGDYVLPKLRARTHESNQFVGNVVNHYLKRTPGKLGITFAVDIESAKEICAEYNRRGVPAEIITGDTDIGIRGKLMGMFRERQILMLVSVDCLGEGVDVPAIEVVLLARRTASWQTLCQQIGRGGRPILNEDEAEAWGDFTDLERLRRIAASVKPHFTIIDCVGNVMYHYEQRGMFDVKQEYEMTDTECKGRKNSGLPPLRPCTSCTQPYERFLVACPYCRFVPMPTSRSTMTAVEGDVHLVDPEVLALLRGEVAKVDALPNLGHTPNDMVGRSLAKHHRDRQAAQTVLRKTMSLWGGWRNHEGEDTRHAQRRFFQTFGIDYITAQTLSTKDAFNLNGKLVEELNRHNISELRR